MITTTQLGEADQWGRGLQVRSILCNGCGIALATDTGLRGDATALQVQSDLHARARAAGWTHPAWRVDLCPQCTTTTEGA